MKRKMLLFLCTIITVICCAFGFAACGDDTDSTNTGNGGTDTEQGGTQKPDDGQDVKPVHTHSLTPVDAEEATCTTDGNIAYYTCSGCDKWFYDEDGTEEVADKDDVVIGKAHKLTPVDAEEATCTTDGNVAYYTCSGCDKWFYDEDGKEEVADKDDVVIGKAHKLSPVDAEEATCTEDGNSAYYTCSGCDKWFADNNAENEITDKKSVIIEKGHKLSPVDAEEATCTTDGNIAYYTCSGCVKWFSDGDAENEITDKDSVIIEKGHKLTPVEAKEATCTKDGNIAYYTCSGCDKYYSDSDGTQEITDKDSVIIDKTGHDLTFVVAKDATCTVNGNTAYYSCGNCDKYYSDSDGTDEITDKDSVIIDKTGHSYVEGACNVCGSLKPTEGLSYWMSFDGENYTYVCLGIGEAEETDIVIADEYEGMPVTAIDGYAFSNCNSLKSVTIPDSITTINNSAFYMCKGLESVIIPDSVTSIGSSVFYGCSNLTSVKLGSGISVLSSTMFRSCSSLESITIPDSVTSISMEAFRDCSNLISVTLGSDVKYINSSAFNGCTNLAEIKYNGTIEKWFEILGFSNLMFYGTNDKKLYIEGQEIKGELTIPTGITSISEYAFYNCSSITGVTFHAGVTSIGSNAFRGCTGLLNIVITSEATIGNSAFRGCTGLKSVTFSSGVTIGENAFRDCTGLESITFPSGVTSIGDNAFNGCSSLKNVTIPASVTSIGDNAFKNCNSDLSITFGGTVEQWEVIGNGNGWVTGYYPYSGKVHCTNGDTSIG